MRSGEVIYMALRWLELYRQRKEWKNAVIYEMRVTEDPVFIDDILKASSEAERCLIKHYEHERKCENCDHGWCNSGKPIGSYIQYLDKKEIVYSCVLQNHKHFNRKVDV